MRLHEKGGKVHEMPCRHSLDEDVHAYLCIDVFGDDKNAFLFRTAQGGGGQLSALPMSQADVYRLVGRRAATVSVDTKIGCPSFRATGITEYLRNGKKLEVAQQLANHVSA